MIKYFKSSHFCLNKISSNKYLFTLLLLFCCPLMALAQRQPQDSIVYLPLEEVYKRSYDAVHVSGIRPTVDGRLDESFWNDNGVWSELFVQTEPYERSLSKQATRMKLLYDDRNIYIGVICEELDIEAVNRFLGNRDEYNLGDYVSVAFDPYHDSRAATQFILNAGGNKSDMVVTDDMTYNTSWNAVWEGRVHVDQEKSQWMAEFRIPFSQLRYSHASEDGVWGLHVRRVIYRNNEIQDWSLIPQNRNGYVYSFGELHNMNRLPKARGIEVMPYTMGKYQNEPAIPGSPYQTGNLWAGNIGVDAKVSLSDYTLDVTVNPDYGQVELDPSVMNLSASETFYDEKRPFFLEGSHIFNTGFGFRTQLLYTRRIGSMPSYNPNVDNVNDFAETGKNVPIIAALKLTGTSRNGVTFGVQQSVTAQAFAHVTRSGSEERIAVEPLTSYSLARVQKNWGGNTLLGGMVTFTARDLKEPHLEELLPGNAVTAGLDFTHYFKERLYYVQAKGLFSTISGSEEAILRRQRNSVHYFQREHYNDYLTLDPTRTSLTGSGGSIEVGRKGNSKWNISESISWISPGLDLNDVGYLSMADQINNGTSMSYTEWAQWLFFRSNTLSFSQRNFFNFGGQLTENMFDLSWKAVTVSRLEWTLGSALSLNNGESRLLRGGPGFLRVPAISGNFRFNTDRGKKIYGEVSYNAQRSVNGDKATNSMSSGFYWRAGNHLYLSAQLNCEWNRDAFQYVATVPNQNPGGLSAYVMGRMVQRTYGLTLRAKANLTPDLSLQFYGAPFTSTAKYDEFKVAAETRAKRYEDRFRMLAPGELQFRDPDFRFNEFRSNLVVRWEYRPGSTLYVVWEHSRSANENGYLPGWGKNLDHLLGLPSVNTFMVKLNYWLAL